MTMSGSRTWRSGMAAAALAPLVAACPPVVTEIEIVPGTVAVASDPTQPTSFDLEARLWSGLESARSSITPGSQVKPTWSIDPASAGVHVAVTPDGYWARVSLDPGSYPTAPVTVKVEAGGIGAESVLVPSVSSSEDLIEAGHTAGVPPDAAIVRGVRTDADKPCAVWLAPALVRLGTAGAVRERCAGPITWEVALLDASKAMAMYPFGWTPGADKVPATAAPAIRVLPVALRVFIGDGPGVAVRQTDAHTYALGEIDDATVALAENRGGIALHLVDDQTISPPPPDETAAFDCAMGETLTDMHDYADGVLEIYLLDDVHGDGFTCPPTNDRPMPIIYLRAGARSENLVLHELGHALGLTLPGTGHSEELAGFDGANVMAGGLVPGQGEAWRTRLTVGQVFRMNADSGSWLSWAKTLSGAPIRDAGEPRVQCQCTADDLPGPCPRVVDDVAKPRHGLAGVPAPHCNDLIVLPALTAGEKPVALLAGRRWRSAPDDCRRDIAGHYLRLDPTDFIELENVTRGGSCPSWLAVFFPDHQPIIVDQNTMVGTWSDAADLRTLTHSLDGLIPITVHVYYDQNKEGEPTTEIAEAKRVFGADGRTGLDLNVVSHSTVPSPCPPYPTGQYAICHVAGGPSVAQLLGPALGLLPLTPAEQADPRLASNVMQTSSSGVPPTLTVGQLFRIHHKIGTPGFPVCGGVPDKCPPIDTDVKP
jgi:hypothetical protein